MEKAEKLHSWCGLTIFIEHMLFGMCAVKLKSSAGVLCPVTAKPHANLVQVDGGMSGG